MTSDFQVDAPAATPQTRLLIIRDFKTGHEDEALYWNNVDGWVNRACATTFSRDEARRVNLPGIVGQDPGWVGADDTSDVRYKTDA